MGYCVEKTGQTGAVSMKKRTRNQQQFSLL